VATLKAVRLGGCKTKYILKATAHSYPLCFFNVLKCSGGVGRSDK